MPYNVLVVDDQALPRQYFETIVNSSPDYTLVASIDTAKVADAYCAAGKIDLIIMDIVMSDGSNGLDVAGRIKSSFPQIKILAVTSMPDATFLGRARDAGVDSFWYKEVQDAPMLEVMNRTMAGEHVWPDSAPVVQIGMADSSEFTERELDVLRCLALGYSNQEIADALYMSVNTVRFHIGNLISKTGLASRIELAIAAAKSGIVTTV